MLGEKLGEEHGKVITRRVLPGGDGRYVKMEITFETQCTILGVQGTNLGTYTVYERIPGQMYGEGQGVFMCAEGGAIWNGHGVGHVTENGAIAFAAGISFQTNVASLRRLNEILAAVEHHTDMEGNASSDLYAWTA